jgi:hypothetical protein
MSTIFVKAIYYSSSHPSVYRSYVILPNTNVRNNKTNPAKTIVIISNEKTMEKIKLHNCNKNIIREIIKYLSFHIIYSNTYTTGVTLISRCSIIAEITSHEPLPSPAPICGIAI